MDDEKKWNLNAPQNDTENNRQNEPPRYEHYCMHQNTESDTVKELPEKKKNVAEKNLQKRFRWQLYSGW